MQRTLPRPKFGLTHLMIKYKAFCMYYAIIITHRIETTR